MADTPADQEFAAEWRQVTEQLLRDQLEELAAGLTWVEAVAALTVRVRRFTAEQLRELDPRIGNVALSRKPPLPWPDDALLATVMLRQWLPDRWPDAPTGLPTLEQLHQIKVEAERAEAAFWGALD